MVIILHGINFYSEIKFFKKPAPLPDFQVNSFRTVWIRVYKKTAVIAEDIAAF